MKGAAESCAALLLQVSHDSNMTVLRNSARRCPPTDEWIKKMWYLYTMEFYAAMKTNEMLSFAGKWMELENFILSEVSLAKKTKNRMFSLICGH
jgi:hypothetical protein